MKRKIATIGIAVFVIFLFLLVRKDAEKNMEVTIEHNGTLHELYELPIFAQTYSKGNWLSAQGIRASIELPNIVNKLPEITWDADVLIHVPEDADLYYIIIFDENYQTAGRYSELEQLQSFFDSTDTGSYYAAIAVTWEGDFIPSMLDYERFGSEFVFGIVKE